jgi:hypothetical protein
MRFILLGAACLAIGSQALGKDNSDRYAKQHKLPSGQLVVIAEGDFEPRSIGSYSVRVYSNEQPQYPTDSFLCGLIRQRNGTIEKVVFADIDKDGVPEIIVTIRSVGTGSYLSADAFTFKDKQLIEVATVDDLPKDADCVTELIKTMKRSSNK